MILEKKNQNLTFTYKNNGLNGLLKVIRTRSKKNALLRKILQWDRKYFVVEKLLKDLVGIEKDIPKYGINKQALKLIEKFKISTSVYSYFDNSNIKKHKGLLIYGVNHNAFIEPLVLLSHLQDKKVKIVLYSMYSYLGKNIARYSLPVVARHYPDNKFFIKKYFDFSQRFRESEGLTDQQIVRMNEKSVKEAAKLLEKGGVVVIFPGGGGSELKKWRFGISRIIMNINKKKRDKITMVPVYFSGMGLKRIIFRVVKAYRSIKQSYLRVGVYFGKEKTISEIYDYLGNKINEDKIILYLRKDAFSQYGLKEFPFKLYLYPRNYPLAISRSLTFLTKIFIHLLPFRNLLR